MPGVPQQEKSGSKMGDWLVRSGLAKDASAANIILTIASLLVFGVSIYFFMFGFSKPTFSGPQQLPAADVPDVVQQ